jgi:hypothetical protein
MPNSPAVSLRSPSWPPPPPRGGHDQPHRRHHRRRRRRDHSALLAPPAVLLGGVVTAACTPATAIPDAPSTAGSTGPIDRWDADQVANAATIVAVGAQRNVPPPGWVIAVATSMQESGLRNLSGGDRDSVGLFQQRPSQGWGTSHELQDPAYAAGKFYDRLLTIPDWQTIDLTDAAQAVQRSAFPDAYAKMGGRRYSAGATTRRLRHADRGRLGHARRRAYRLRLSRPTAARP